MESNLSMMASTTHVDYDYFSETQEEPLYKLRSKIFGSIVWGTACAVGVPGNLIVLSVIVLFKDMRASISNIFIFNLALADLFFLCGTPIVIIQSLKNEWIFGEGMCKAFLSGNGINQLASAMFIGVLSFDRYIAVCHPVRSVRYRSQRNALILCVASWTIVTLEMIPLMKFAHLVKMPITNSKTCMVFWGSQQSLDLIQDQEDAFSHSSDNTMEPNSNNITLNATARPPINYESVINLVTELQLSSRIFTAYSFCLSYLLPLIGIWFFYVNIIAGLWIRRRQLFRNSRNSSANSGRRRTTTKVTIMGLAVVISYTLCWLPFWFVQWSIETEASWTTYHSILMPVSYAAYALQYINSAANPFLYVFLTDTFREKVFGRRKRRPSEGAINGCRSTYGDVSSIRNGAKSSARPQDNHSMVTSLFVGTEKNGSRKKSELGNKEEIEPLESKTRKISTMADNWTLAASPARQRRASGADLLDLDDDEVIGYGATNEDDIDAGAADQNQIDHAHNHDQQQPLLLVQPPSTGPTAVQQQQQQQLISPAVQLEDITLPTSVINRAQMEYATAMCSSSVGLHDLQQQPNKTTSALDSYL